MQFPRDLDEQRKVMYEAQLKTNELLEKLVQLHTKTTATKPVKSPINKTKTPNKPPRGKTK